MTSRRQFMQQSLIGACAAVLPGLTTGKSLPGRAMTPDDQGFRFPAEWRKHAYTIMQFVPAQNWAGYGLRDAQRDWASVANTINDYEPVLMVTTPDDRAVARKLLSSDIERVEFPMNDGWARDSAPLFLVNDEGQLRASHFVFNGWGEKFPPYADDARLKHRISKHLGVSAYESPLVMEGGAVSLDGEGTLITTRECLLNGNRNPDWSEAEVERELKDQLGATTIIWLDRGLTPDPITDGHVDGICVFVGPGTVMLHTTDDRSDPNFPICQSAKRVLKSSRTASGKPLEIIELPLAEQVAHINFYIANGVVVVPTSGNHREDDAPLGILRETFPERDVIGVSGRTLAEGGGGVHCITQQVPEHRSAG